MNPMAQRPVIVKIGGSLFDVPDLGTGLESFCAGLNTTDVVLVPGGGPSADVVRAWDRDFRLGEVKSHWLALRALTLNAHLLASVLPKAQVIQRLEERRILLAADITPIVDMHAWAVADESSTDHLPHTWNVTSDSLAARLAMKCAAAELVLLKSIAFLGEDWRQAACAGIVDPYFPEIMARAGPELHVRLVNFRKLGAGQDRAER
jgi:aspartokinase-like uncharacterized kinase